MTLGERLKIARIMNGYTAESLALACGIKRSLVSIWESGKNGMNRESAARISDQLRIPAGHLGYGDRLPAQNVFLWTPKSPARPQFLAKAKADILALLPEYLNECGLDQVIVCALPEDKCIFLLGSEHTFNVLVVLDNGLRKEVEQSLSGAGIKTTAVATAGTIREFLENISPDTSCDKDALLDLVSTKNSNMDPAVCRWVLAFDGHYNISCPSGQRANGQFKPPHAGVETKWNFDFCPYCGRKIVVQGEVGGGDEQE